MILVCEFPGASRAPSASIAASRSSRCLNFKRANHSAPFPPPLQPLERRRNVNKTLSPAPKSSRKTLFEPFDLTYGTPKCRINCVVAFWSRSQQNERRRRRRADVVGLVPRGPPAISQRGKGARRQTAAHHAVQQRTANSPVQRKLGTKFQWKFLKKIIWFFWQQLSQFWYSDATAEKLADEVVRAAGPQGRIALVSCPTLYAPVKRKCTNSGED